MNDGLARLWGIGAIRVFISHVSENKRLAHDIKRHLAGWNIAAFVAHDDIEPSREWARELFRALNSMDLLVALLTSRFHESLWTDQEIGFAFGREKQVLAVQVDQAPYGFMADFQAITRVADASEIASEIFKCILGDDALAGPTVDVYISALRGSKSFKRSNDLAVYLPRIETLTADQEANLVVVYNTNNQVQHAGQIQGQIVDEMRRITGHAYEITDWYELRRFKEP